MAWAYLAGTSDRGIGWWLRVPVLESRSGGAVAVTATLYQPGGAPLRPLVDSVYCPALLTVPAGSKGASTPTSRHSRYRRNRSVGTAVL